MHHCSFLCLGSPLLLAAVLVGQSGGPTLGLAQGLSIDPLTALPGFTPGSVVTTRTDLDADLAVPIPPVGAMPDFGALPIPVGLDVDALSLGYDWIPSDGAGFAVVPPGSWAALTWSVRRSTLGAPGSKIAEEVVAADGAAGDVFGYVFPGSALPPLQVGVPFRGLDSLEINISSPGLPGDLDAHDLYIGLVYVENPQIAVLLPPPTLFFSVTATSAASIPLAWGPPSLRNGATVFSTTWDPQGLTWTPPGVALPAAMLGITDGEDLDGLAIDLLHGRVVFSTDLALVGPFPLRNPLLYANLYSGTHVTYRLPGGMPVATAIGLGGGPDDIDGICFVDPGGPGGGGQLRFDRVVGRPGQPVLPPALTTVQVSLSRRFDHVTGTERAVTMMTGWPPGGQGNGFALQAFTIGPPAIGPWVTDGFYLRPAPQSPYFVFQGHPHRHEFTIPAGFVWSNVTLSSLWGVVDAGSFAVSHPVTLVL